MDDRIGTPNEMPHYVEHQRKPPISDEVALARFRDLLARRADIATANDDNRRQSLVRDWADQFAALVGDAFADIHAMSNAAASLCNDLGEAMLSSDDALQRGYRRYTVEMLRNDPKALREALYIVASDLERRYREYPPGLANAMAAMLWLTTHSSKSWLDVLASAGGGQRHFRNKLILSTVYYEQAFRGPGSTLADVWDAVRRRMAAFGDVTWAALAQARTRGGETLGRLCRESARLGAQHRNTGHPFCPPMLGFRGWDGLAERLAAGLRSGRRWQRRGGASGRKS